MSLRFALLYGRDGGFFLAGPSANVLGLELPPEVINPLLIGDVDEHPGDSEKIAMTIDLVRDADGAWFADLRAVDVANQQWSVDVEGSDSTEIECSTRLAEAIGSAGFLRLMDCRPEPNVRTLDLVGNTHPVVIASWGKHHQYLNVPNGRWEWAKVSIPVLTGPLCTFGGLCPVQAEVWSNRERTLIERGGVVGSRLIPVLRMPLPTPADPPRPLNVGALVGDEDCASPLPTRIGGPDSATLDADGDGAINRTDLCPSAPPAAGLAVHADADGDGAGDDACDPNPSFRDAWVGPGFPERNLRAYSGAPGFVPNLEKIGWLDTDADGLLNGADLCPSTSGGLIDRPNGFANPNAWGEQASFVSHSLETGDYSFYDDPAEGYDPGPQNLGFISRGTACDPYETAVLVQDPLGPDDVRDENPCSLAAIAGQFSVGSPEVRLSATALRGVSSNDPTLTGATYLQRLEQARGQRHAVRLDVRRCGCTAFDPTKTDQENRAACMDPFTGQCPQAFPLRQDQFGGLFWRPVQYEGCTTGDGDYCNAFPATAAVPLPALCNGPICPPASADLDPKPESVDWLWEEELADPATADHFPPGWFEQASGRGTGAPYTRSTVGFTFAVRTFLNGFPDDDVNPYRWAPDPRQPGNQADIDPARVSDTGTLLAAGDPARRERTGNLRVVFTEQFTQPAGPRIELRNPPPECSRIFQIGGGINFVRWAAATRGCFPPGTCERDPAGWSITHSTVDLAATALVRLGTGITQPVRIYSTDGVDLGGLDRLLSACEPDGAGDFSAIDQLPPILPPDVPPDVPEGDQAFRLATVVAEGATEKDRPTIAVTTSCAAVGAAGDASWILEPIGSVEATAGYRIAAAGLAPAGVATADALFASDDGRHLIAFREADASAPASLAVLDLTENVWREVGVDPSLGHRSGAAYVLRDNALYRAGGSDGVALRGDVTVLDWRNGRIFVDAIGGEPLPPRLRPALAWDQLGGGLVYAGGIDTDGRARNDVWSLRVGAASAVRLGAGLEGTPPILDGALLLASGASGFAQWWDAPIFDGESDLRHSVRALDAGTWVAVDVRTKEPIAAACGDGSAPRLCATGRDWWRTPGGACPGGGCVPGRLESEATSSVLPRRRARDIALDGSTLWVARGRTLELWSLLRPGAPELLDALTLGSKIRSVEVGKGAVGVGTDAGLLQVSTVAGACATIDPVVELCGPAVDAVPAGPDRWFVATTGGAALVERDQRGSLRAASEVLLTPSGRELAIPACARAKVCRGLRKLGCRLPGCKTGRHRASFDGRDAELLRGTKLVRLTWDGDGQLSVRDRISLHGRGLAVRSTADRAYVVRRRHRSRRSVTVDLDDQLRLDGPHDVAAWVRSEQSGSYRARLGRGGRVEVAWVR